MKIKRLMGACATIFMHHHIKGITKFGMLLLAVIVLSACSQTPEYEEDPDFDPRFARPNLPTLNVESLALAPDEGSLYGMVSVASSDYYELFLHLETTDIALKHLPTGTVVHSNPERGNDTLTLNEGQRPANVSILELETTNLGGQVTMYTSYTHSVALEQFYFMAIPNGVHISFTLGQDETARLLPPVLREETFEYVRDQLEGDDLAIFRQNYRLLRHDRLPSEERASLLNRFPQVEFENLYILRDIGRHDRNLIETILQSVDFDRELMVYDMLHAGFEFDSTDIIFTVGVDLFVDNNGLVARVDLDGLVTIEGSRITDISLLRGFGATNCTDGFIFMPDGSGILMDLQTPMTSTISRPIYGADPAVGMTVLPPPSMQVVMPVFGMRTSNHALFAVVQEGAAISRITARTRTHLQPTANIHVDITANAKDFRDYGGLRTNPTGVVMPTDPPVAAVEVRYVILPNHEDFDWTYFAAYYRDTLVNQGVLTRQEPSITPFFMEFPSVLTSRVSVAGVPMNRDIPLTSFEQAEYLLGLMMGAGVEGIRTRHVGWANGDLFNRAFTSSRPNSAAGSVRDLENFLDFASSNDIDVFLDTPVDVVSRIGFRDGFNHRQDAARRLDRRVALTGPYRASDRQMFFTTYILAPDATERFWGEFRDSFASRNWDVRLSLGNMGANLPSCYRVDYVMTRERSEEVYRNIFTQAVDVAGPIMVEVGNAYTWEFASEIINLPSAGSGFQGQARSVPFVQMVLHGHISYALSPLNLSNDMTVSILRAVETGAGLYVQMMYADDTVFVFTIHDFTLFSLNYYHRWAEYAAAYVRVASALNHVSGALMIGHAEVEPGVFAVEYDNGVTIFVNYNRTYVYVDGVYVGAEDFTVVGV